MSRASADPITIRAGEDADIPAVIELMRAALGEGNVPRTSEFWHWKHRHNPFGASPMWLALSEDKLVGVRLFLRWCFVAGERSYPAVRAVDTATHPEFQGKGIFKRLTLKLVEEEQRAGTQLVFNTPNAKSRPGYLKMGWQTLGRLPLWVSPRRPLRLLGALMTEKRPAEDDPTPLPEAAGLDDLNHAEQSGLLAGSSQRLHTPVSARYLAWRYAAPGLRYGAVVEPDALLVFRLRRRGQLRELRVCDAFSRPSTRGARALRHCLSRVVRQHQPDYVISALNLEPRQMLTLASSGFMLAPLLGPIMTVRRLGPSWPDPDPLHLRSWSASIGDLELF